MATVATAMYSASYHHAFIAPTTTRPAASTVPPQQPIHQEPEVLEEQFTTIFCRALYDYEAQDPSALSFRQNDIIEVLTQQPSGWWDGLLGDERGWFPSNYVVVISDEEAELAFSGSEYQTTEVSLSGNQADTSVVDMSHALMQGNQSETEDWSETEMTSSRSGLSVSTTVASNGGVQSSDFWVPQVAPDGRIFYVNTQTGQRSRDLPQEPEDEISDGDLAALTSQSSSRSGTGAGLGFAPSEVSNSLQNAAGFGIVRRSGTPEPWVRKLADDGMSYYYFNKLDGTVQWTRPEAPLLPPPSTNSTPPPSLQPPNGNARNRSSVYSDDSDVQPPEPSRSGRLQTNGSIRRPPPPEEHVVMQLTSAEKIAQSLQKSLSPPPAELVTDLSALARSSIQAVVDSIQVNGLVRRPEQDQQMDNLIHNAVNAVRNLLYISSAPTGQIASNVLPRDARDYKPHPSHASLKPAQRKVTATLSRLVLSARAMQYDSGSLPSDTLHRIEVDAEELERAVLSFVLEVQRTQHAALPEDARSPKRLRGVFETANVGLGLVGAGAAGKWKGFGWVSLNDQVPAPTTLLRTEVIAEVEAQSVQIQNSFASFLHLLRASDETAVEQVRLWSHELTARLSAILAFITDIHVARHVDVDGIRQDAGSTANDRYMQTVEKARVLVRMLESVVQSMFDDSTAFFLTAQKISDSDIGQTSQHREDANGVLTTLSGSLQAKLATAKQTLEALLSVGHDQADMAQGDYNGSIEWRISRLSVIDNRFGGAVRPKSPLLGEDIAGEDIVDMEHAIGRPAVKIQKPLPDAGYGLYGETVSDTEADYKEASTSQDYASSQTHVASSSVDLRDLPDDEDDNFDDVEDKPIRQSNKLKQILGEGFPDKPIKPPPPPRAPEPQPWYLQPNYDPAEIAIDTDKSVRGGTVPALVERLTAHEQADPTFIKAFLMTYKSFTTLDELFDLLVARFRIQPPDGLTPAELEKWTKLKQHVIQMRVINTWKSMVVDDDILEKEDLYILDRMKEFISTEEVSKLPAAKQLMILIERLQRGGGAVPKTMANQGAPPPPIIPKTNKKLKLLDIEPLELARQLTIMESILYQRIKPMECLQRAREQKTENIDNITLVIQTSNRIALWVADSILSKEDSRRRAAAVKHLISVADRCRTLNNFSTMIAITSGLNTPPIRRLKRTWEQVNQRFMAQFAACEMTIDSNKNFNKYRQLMANVTPPCVPFIGVFLSTLQFIQDGNPDNLPGNLVNFRKRQKASEVINDIKRWQAQPFNFQPIPSVQSYIEESLNQFNDTRAFSEYFWTLSLEREPREREDEKMARLLQESGFL